MRRTSKANKPRFYDFSSRGYLTTFAVRSRIFNEMISKRVLRKGGEFYDKLIHGTYDGIEFPVVFDERRDEYGKKRMRDILDTRYPPVYLISDRLKSLLEDNNVTGWKPYPITLFDKKGNEVPGYNGLSFTGRAGRERVLGESEYTQHYDPTCDPEYRIIFSDGSWDGSDIFMVEGTRAVIVTARVMELLKSNKVTACDFRPLADVIQGGSDAG